MIRYDAFGRVGSVSAPYHKGRTTTHEVGHWLGLRHIWGDGGCSVDDYCSDTPASDAANYGCTATTSCGSQDQIENYMDYSDDLCMDMFTACQKTRMQTVLTNSPRRSTLGTSTVCSGGNSAPTASFSADKTSICPGGTVQFSDNSTGGPTSWSWTFSGGTPSSSTNQNPLVSYANAGTYNVSLTATNGNGSNSTTQNGYIVVGTGSASVFWSEDFENNGAGWQAYNPDNQNTWVIATVGGSVTGTKAAKIDMYNNNLVGQYDGLISPAISFVGKSNVTVEFEHAHRRYSANEADSLILYVSTNGGTSFPFRIWGDAENGSGNFATNSQTQNDFTPSTPDDWCFAGSVGASCFSFNLSQFDGQSNVKLMWYAYNDYGNNIYVDNIKLSASCSATASAPVAAFSVNESSGCAPLNVTFSDQSTGSPTAWSWTFTGGSPAFSLAQNPSVTYASPGTYSVSLTATNATGSNVVTQTNYITVFSNPPVPVISLSGSNLTTAVSATSYQWFLNGAPISGATSQNYTPAASGAYTVTVVDANGCSNTSSPYQYDLVGLEALANQGLEIYPNPTSGAIWLKSALPIQIEKLEIIDGLGRSLIQQNWNGKVLDQASSIDLGGLSEGIYFLKIRTGDEMVVRKFTLLK
ncbi:MAG: PKD domain-containing protein [Bacteroidia bacterium]|nr:PKD domain-containing protein [Bacteroidia bacterium]